MCTPMCETFGRCHDSICTCHPTFGYGEAMEVYECSLNNTIVDSVWLGTLVLTMFLLCCSLLVLARWVRSCDVDWWKLITYRNAPLLFGSMAIQIFYGVYALLRLYDHVTAFNDYGATVVFVLAEMSTLLQCIPLADLCHGALVGLLRAVGVTEGISDRTWSTRAVWICLSTVPFLPALAGPALTPVQRGRLAQYFLITYIVVFASVAIPICVAGEKAIKLLKSLGTEPTKTPMRKIRLLCVNLYILLLSTTTLQVMVSAKFMSTFPYQIAFLSPLKAIALFLPVLALHYDPEVIQKRIRPNTPMVKAGSASQPASKTDSITPMTAHTELV